MMCIWSIHICRELREQDCSDDECDAVAEVSENQRPATTCVVDNEHAKSLGAQRDDGVVCLVLECIPATDAHLAVDRDRVVCNGVSISFEGLSGSAYIEWPRHLSFARRLAKLSRARDDESC